MPEITKSGCKSSKDSEVITPNINVSRTTDASSSSSYPNLGERITCSCGQTFYEWEEVRIGEINLIKNTIKIFHGATGQIFHAYSQQTNKCLIIKEIFLEVEDDRERTRQEWMANNELNILLYFKTRNLNERIVEIIDYGNLYEDRGKCFVMEQGNETLFRYMNDVKDRFSTINISPNGTSRRIYREKKRFGRIILQIMLEVAKAIHEFHKYAIHLDIKSTNFICFRKGNKRCFVKLIDFNSSVLLNGQNEVEAFSYGACNYKSYEIRGREDMDIDQTFMVTTKSDIMSFGLMFYFFLHFEIEFNELNISESYNIIDQNLINFHQSITKSSNYLDRVIKACTHYEPTERPSAWAIINFIENRCHVFASEEQEEYEIICEELEN